VRIFRLPPWPVEADHNRREFITTITSKGKISPALAVSPSISALRSGGIQLDACRRPGGWSLSQSACLSAHNSMGEVCKTERSDKMALTNEMKRRMSISFAILLLCAAVLNNSLAGPQPLPNPKLGFAGAQG
jgi:hypothetical protein